MSIPFGNTTKPTSAKIADPFEGLDFFCSRPVQPTPPPNAVATRVLAPTKTQTPLQKPEPKKDPFADLLTPDLFSPSQTPQKALLPNSMTASKTADASKQPVTKAPAKASQGSLSSPLQKQKEVPPPSVIRTQAQVPQLPPLSSPLPKPANAAKQAKASDTVDARIQAVLTEWENFDPHAKPTEAPKPPVTKTQSALSSSKSSHQIADPFAHLVGLSCGFAPSASFEPLDKKPSLAPSLSGAPAQAFAPGALGSAAPRDTSSLPPIGINNASANCWLNSLMQMFIHIPSLNGTLRRLDKTGHKPIHDFMDGYGRDQQTGRPVAEHASSQTLREHLSKISQTRTGTGISPFSFKQEDAGQGMMMLLRDAEPPKDTPVLPPPFFQIESEFCGRRSDPDVHQILDLSPHPDPKVNYSFAQMMKNYFQSDEIIQKGRIIGPNDEREFRGKKTNYMLRPPSDLLVQINRFAPDPQTGKYMKNANKMDTPARFQMPAAYSRSGESPIYDCDAFIVHTGSIGGGHYVCYMKKNGQWFRLNDSTVTRADEREVEEYRAIAYIFHYTKV